MLDKCFELFKLYYLVRVIKITALAQKRLLSFFSFAYSPPGGTIIVVKEKLLRLLLQPETPSSQIPIFILSFLKLIHRTESLLL